MWMETAAGERFADLRAEEAVDTGVDVLVTACPHCIACLEDSLKVPGKGMVVMDVAELLAEALGLNAAPKPAANSVSRSAK